jgi:hypothetical protein
VERLTVRFPVGAEASVTVPVEVQPPVTVLGERLRETTDSVTTLRMALAEECELVA